MLPKPKLPRRAKKRAKFYTVNDVAKIIAASQGEDRVFYWLAAETELRTGEIAGVKLTDIEGERLTVNRSVWGGKDQSPKTNNAIRTIGLSPQLISLLWEQIARQRKKEREYLFSASTGSPVDMNVYRRRKMTVLLKSLGIPQAGFHAFIQVRAGHALTGVFTLDVYGGSPEWERNLEAGRVAGSEIEKAGSKLKNERSSALIGSLLAIQEKKARKRHLLSLWISVSSLVAGVGFEPTTFGL
jgi:integrase